MLDLFTIIWGGDMIESYLKLTLPSLLQKGNVPAAREHLHGYRFYASLEAKKAISESGLYQKLVEGVEVEWFPLQKGERETTSNYLHQMKASVSAGNYMLIMPPDTLVGNGSILNMAKLCDAGHNPVLFGFPRVNEEGYEVLKSIFAEREEVSNRELVTIGVRYIEQVTYFVAEDKDDDGDYYVVRHHAPTSCLRPDKNIYDICATNKKRFGDFDQSLSYIMVRAGYPWYLVRNSDEFFWVERGRHFVHQIAPIWDLQNHLLALDFFKKQDVIWRGV